MTLVLKIGDILTVTKNSTEELGMLLNVIFPHINCKAILPLNNIPQTEDNKKFKEDKNYIVKIINILKNETNTTIIVTRLNISKKTIKQDLHAVILLNKPIGYSSNAALQKVKYHLKDH